MGRKNALIVASVASMVDLFNRDNIEMLTDLGCRVTVACNFSEGSVYTKEQAHAFMKELLDNGHDVINIPVPRKLYDIKGMFKTYIMLYRDMRKKNYSIIHCQAPISGVLCRLAAIPFRKKGTKVMYYAHGFHFFKGAPLKYWLMYYSAEKICANFTDCVLTLNREDYKRASRFFNTKVIKVPGVGIDLDEIEHVKPDRNKICREFGIDTDKKIILSAGELSERKNTKTAIRAFIHADRKDAVLVLCGIGEKEEELKQYVRECNARDRIIFAGFRNDIINIFKIADIFIFTSKQEGLPVVVMQAMASGLPVLCSDIRGNKDLIRNGHGGFMYDPSDTLGYAEGISQLLDDEDLRKAMGMINERKVKKYSISAVNNMMRRIYCYFLQ